MGASVNTWIVTGKLVKDAEQKKTKAGKLFAVARLEYTTGWGDNLKNSRVGIAAFGELAERLLERGFEGTAILLNASVDVTTRKTDGKFETFVNVTAKEIEFVEDLDSGEDAPSRKEDKVKKAYEQAYQQPADDDDSEEIPF